MAFEVWDRVTGQMVGEYATSEEAEASIPVTYEQDFLIIDADED